MMARKEQDLLGVSVGPMLRLPALRTVGKHAWHEAGAPTAQLGLEQHPRKASDDSSREAQQKDKHNVCPDFSLATLSATGAMTSAHFSSPHRGAL